jgi:predicted nucleic acid-binding protein
LAELNRHITAGDVVDDARVITGRRTTVAAAFAAELPTLTPPPAEPFDPALLLCTRVDLRARVVVRQCYYSVPARYVGRRLAVRLSATTVEVLDTGKVIARHERAAGRYVETLVLDHYLEVLARKPGALPGATALAQAKACGAFTATHQRFWDVARRVRGDAAGTRALIELLLAHRNLPRQALQAAMNTATETGLIDPTVVLIDARRHAGHTGEDQPDAVVPIGGWARYDRPVPTLAAYDQLLTGSEG